MNTAIQKGNLTEFKGIMSGLNDTNPIVGRSLKSGAYFTALHSAAKFGKVDIVKFLHRQNKDMHPYDSVGITPMHYAAQYNQTEVIKYYLQSSEILIKSPKRNGSVLSPFYQREPIHYATQGGWLEMIKQMIPYLDDKNPKDANLYTPLHLAAKIGHLEIVKLLTDNISDTNPHASAFWNYDTPLHKAAYFGNLETVKYLVQDRFVDATEKSQDGFFGRTAYEDALRHKKTDVAEFLAEYIEPKISLSKERTCNKNNFKCSNGDCVESQLTCDGLPPECNDESDLLYCEKNLLSQCVGPKYEECPLIKECFIPDLKRG